MAWFWQIRPEIKEWVDTVCAAATEADKYGYVEIEDRNTRSDNRFNIKLDENYTSAERRYWKKKQSEARRRLVLECIAKIKGKPV
jgi:hypothetical protein